MDRRPPSMTMADEGDTFSSTATCVSLADVVPCGGGSSTLKVTFRLVVLARLALVGATTWDDAIGVARGSDDCTALVTVSLLQWQHGKWKVIVVELPPVGGAKAVEAASFEAMVLCTRRSTRE